MKKSDMVCRKCIKFEDPGAYCHLDPIPVDIAYHRDPDTHWCAQGAWREWSKRHKEWLLYYWGENTDED